MKKIKVPYFPIGVKIISPIFLGIGIYLGIIGYPAWMAAFALVTILIWTTEYVTELDLDKKQVHDYLSVLTIQFQEEKELFDKLEKIVIRSEHHSQMLNSRSRSRQLDWSSYTGILLHDGGRTLDLLTKTDKHQLIIALIDYAKLFNVEVEDQTTSRHYLIDMDKA